MSTDQDKAKLAQLWAGHALVAIPKLDDPMGWIVANRYALGDCLAHAHDEWVKIKVALTARCGELGI